MLTSAHLGENKTDLQQKILKFQHKITSHAKEMEMVILHIFMIVDTTYNTHMLISTTHKVVFQLFLMSFANEIIASAPFSLLFSFSL